MRHLAVDDDPGEDGDCAVVFRLALLGDEADRECAFRRHDVCAFSAFGDQIEMRLNPAKSDISTCCRVIYTTNITSLFGTRKAHVVIQWKFFADCFSYEKPADFHWRWKGLNPSETATRPRLSESVTTFGTLPTTGHKLVLFAVCGAMSYTVHPQKATYQYITKGYGDMRIFITI